MGSTQPQRGNPAAPAPPPLGQAHSAAPEAHDGGRSRGPRSLTWRVPERLRRHHYVMSVRQLEPLRTAVARRRRCHPVAQVPADQPLTAPTLIRNFL
jgi:hypothetical protein